MDHLIFALHEIEKLAVRKHLGGAGYVPQTWLKKSSKRSGPKRIPDCLMTVRSTCLQLTMPCQFGRGSTVKTPCTYQNTRKGRGDGKATRRVQSHWLMDRRDTLKVYGPPGYRRTARVEACQAWFQRVSAEALGGFRSLRVRSSPKAPMPA